MQQGHSGSFVERVGATVRKITADGAFAQNLVRQKDLISLSRRLKILPRIIRVEGDLIEMEFIGGSEGLTAQNAFQAGASLRLLHDRRDFPHPCLTGIGWLIEMANANLIRAGASMRFSEDLARQFQNDALIHSEPTQFIESTDGEIVFIDIEGVGLGSRYQDLGFIEYITNLRENSEALKSFMKGYNSEPIALDARRMRWTAGLTAIAYSGFADTERRLALGIRLIQQSESM